MEVPRLLAACCFALSVAGCAVPTPPTSAAGAPPPQWQAPLPHNGSVGDLSQWWQSLGDPVLVQLVQAAQAASPTLASAQSRVIQGRAARALAAAALSPTLDANASAARGVTRTLLPTATEVQASLQASWEIDLFGANRRAEEAAQARLESAQAQWHSARVSVAAEVATVYFSQRACELQWAIAQADATSRVQTARLTGLSAQAGFTAPGTFALARASAAEANAILTQQRASCDLDIKALVALTALPEAVLRQELAAAPTDLAPAASLTLGSVPAQALNQRPDLFSAQREVAAASADVGQVRAQAYPSLTLSGSVGLQGYRALGLSETGATWSIGPLLLSVPVFDAGRNAANLEAAQARYDEAAFLYGARVRQAVREVEEALVRLRSTAERDGDAVVADQSYRESLDAAQARYQRGLASLVELETTRRVALASTYALVALRRERIQAWIALYRAVGGGWSQPEATQ